MWKRVAGRVTETSQAFHMHTEDSTLKDNLTAQ